MLVGNRMTQEPVTIGPDSFLSQAKEKMETGRFRRVPVVREGKLVGILTDRDMRAHTGYFEKTKASGVMTEKVITVDPSTTHRYCSSTRLAACRSSIGTARRNHYDQ
jgi:acetoin utilization protein AcuB